MSNYSNQDIFGKFAAKLRCLIHGHVYFFYLGLPRFVYTCHQCDKLELRSVVEAKFEKLRDKR